ncbi:S-methyl-5'-thioadenosine phosphorylase [Candidatus Contubernalis alkaliaceticus]|uniref:S-methyl-5'-thioadenosine phosphorylase n=1 Tax=Candidatus Contubernalis alkaliaceticus TaxID=338645 RepID=UPI001F4C221B|nr:S-methyl-5'-thioadenosine phosphorylase [Candidatus Contubernalis alkalaceticus]UNC92439.1 S-methyl-5'-thioadenosine phosphorylase [Candidatus Contubernalis alkalaceticus]
MEIRVGVIGGTGVYDPKILEDLREIDVDTPYGKALIYQGSFQGKEVCFLPRHGMTHGVPPHKINYRANIWALKKVGVNRIISTAAVGSLNEEMPPGSAVLIDQFIDFTKQRALTFFEDGQEGVVHTDFTEPYCPEVRKHLLENSAPSGLKVLDYGTYVCTEGPRFETPAEIKMFRSWGGDVVGMTNVPEVVLAREVGLCYATVTLVTNYAAGISKSILTHEEVLQMMAENIDKVKQLIMGTIAKMPKEVQCNCEKTPGKMVV